MTDVNEPEYLIIFETLDGSPCSLSAESRDGLSKHFHAALKNKTMQPTTIRVEGMNVVRIERLNPPTPNQMVREFHETYGQPVLTEPTIPQAGREELRRSLISEEGEIEFPEAIDMPVSTEEERRAKLVAIADALGDLLYVTYGAAHEYGIDLDAVVAEIHRSNMSKLDDEGKPIYRHDGKVTKGPNFVEPNLYSILFPEVAA